MQNTCIVPKILSWSHFCTKEFIYLISIYSMHYSLRSYHYLAECLNENKNKTLGKMHLWRVFFGHSIKMYFSGHFFWHTAKCIFVEGHDKSIFPSTFWGLKRIQMKKFSTTKLYNFSRSTSFILSISSFDKVKVTFFRKSTSLSYVSYSFRKLEDRDKICEQYY